MTPLFRVVLSDVPTHLAGVGSGVLTTMQQTALWYLHPILPAEAALPLHATTATPEAA